MPPEDPPPIEGVSTAVTAFIGRTASGPVEVPTQIASVFGYVSVFGAMSADCPLSCAVEQFFANGGTSAVVIRLDSGQSLTAANFIDPTLESQQRGIWTLRRASWVNLIVIPPLAPGVDVPVAVWNAAISLAEQLGMFVLVDPPAAWASVQAAISGVDSFVTRSANAALYFPRLLVKDPVHAGQTLACAPSAMIAGVYSRMDTLRGVWRAPAGMEAELKGVVALSVSLGTPALEALNQKAVNALRAVPGGHQIVWGARTLMGADGLASEWKYVPVRRLFLFIERSIIKGTQWAVSEPNEEPTWQKVREQVGTFLRDLWRDGAMQGSTERDAFFVRCDLTTMTQEDIDNGRLVILVGVAPLKPAEFVVVRIHLGAR